MARNNSFREIPQDTPLPRDFEGGPSDFGLIRTVDGHDHYPDMEDDGSGRMQPSYRNCNYPEDTPEDGMY